LTNKKTKLIILAYIYGVRYDIDDIIDFCKENNIQVIEDIAESYEGPKESGNPRADMSVFSFGSIKTDTAFGGGVAVIRNNPSLYNKMVEIHNTYPIQNRKIFIKKLIKLSLIINLIKSSCLNRVSRRIFNALNFDYKEYCVSMLRGFRAQDNFLHTFRIRPSIPLVYFLYYRLSHFNKQAFIDGNNRLLIAQKLLSDHGVIVPGHKTTGRNFWLFPIIVPDVEMCFKYLNSRGLDVYKGATQLKVIPAPKGFKEHPAQQTQEFFNTLLYLPIDKQVPERDIRRICDETIEVIEGVKYIKEIEERF